MASCAKAGDYLCSGEAVKPFIDLIDQMNQVTLNVERQYGFKFKNKWRVLLGLRVIHLGCWIAGLNFEETKE